MRRFINMMVIVVMMAVTLIGFMPLNVRADSNPKIVLSDVNRTDGYSDMCDSINEAIWEELGGGWASEGIQFLSCEIDNNDVTITVNMENYNKLSQKLRQKVMQAALSGIYNSKVARTSKTKIYNDLAVLDSTTSSLVRQMGSDVQADYVGAYNMFKPWSSWVGILFGLIALGMFLIMGFTFIVDIAYINLPMFQLFLAEISQNKSGKPAYVSLEAWSAVKEADSKAGQEYVNPTMFYLKHKTKQFCIVAICLLYLTSGEIYTVLANMIDYFRGVLPN